MKILIVHDRQSVAEEIASLIAAEGISDCNTSIAIDGASASEALRESLFDLVILDLTLPYISQQTPPSVSTAENLLRELFSLGTFNPPGDVIGLSRERDAVEQISSSIGPHLMAMIEEDDAGRWRKYLIDRIKYAQRSSEHRQFSAYRHHNIDALIITALDSEFAPYKSLLDLQPMHQFAGAQSFIFRGSDGGVRKGVAFSIGRSGQPRAASRAQSLLSVFRPRLCLMTGFCGGFAGRAKPLELLLFETIYDWDYGKWQTPRAKRGAGARAAGEKPPAQFVSRPVPLSIDGSRSHKSAREFERVGFKGGDEILAALEAEYGKLKPNGVSRAQIASGSAVVAHETVIERIVHLNDHIRGVDMESYGIYHAALHTHVAKPEVLCIKGVADGANSRKSDELHAPCSALSAAAAVHILRNLYEF